MIRRIALATAAVTTAALASGLSLSAPAGAATPATAAPVDQGVSLPIGSPTGLLLDHPAQLLVTAGSSGVAVGAPDGSGMTLVAGTAGVRGLALGPDSGNHDPLVYASEGDTDQIMVIDPATKTVVHTWPTGVAACPGDIAFAGSDLWFAYSCDRTDVNDQTPAGIAHLDLTDGTVTTQLAHAASGATTFLASVPGQTGELVATGTAGGSDLSVLTLSGTTATIGRQVEAMVGAVRPTVTADGTKVLLATYDGVHTFDLADLSSAVSLPIVGTSVALSDDQGHLAVTSPQYGQASLNTFAYPSGSSIHAYPANPSSWKVPAANGLAWDGSRLLAIYTSEDGQRSSLHLLNTALQAPSSMTLSAPASATRAVSHVTISGQVPGLTAGEAVTLTKTDLAGTHTLKTLTTDAIGRFSYVDVPQVGSTNTYTATFAGDQTHQSVSKSVNVSVSRQTVAMSIKLNASTYNYHQTGQVKVHVISYNGKTVQIWAKVGVGPTHFVKTLVLDSQGVAYMNNVLTMNTQFQLRFPGDYVYNPSNMSAYVSTRAAMAVASAGNYGTAGAYRLVQYGNDFAVATQVTPAHPNSCVRFEAQYYSGGAWRNGPSVDCMRLDSDSIAGALFSGYRNIAYRLRAVFAGDAVSAGNATSYVYVVFR